MREVTIGPNEAGQRFDKFLKKYLKEAGSGFLYKMLRKKNITLNGSKADGSEKLTAVTGMLLFGGGNPGKIPGSAGRSNGAGQNSIQFIIKAGPSNSSYL